LRTVVQGLINVIKSFQRQIDTTNLAEFKSYKKLLNETKELLDKITLSEDGGSQSKLIILVGEIDRCFPDVQLTALSLGPGIQKRPSIALKAKGFKAF